MENKHPIYKFLIEQRKVAGVWPIMILIEGIYLYFLFLFQVNIVMALVVVPIHLISMLLCSVDYFILPNLITILQVPKVITLE